jgi:hypothetical protein
MKILRNPYIVGVLVLVAIITVSWNLLRPLWRRILPARQPQRVSFTPPLPSPAPVIAETKPAVKPSPDTPRVVPDASIDSQDVQMNLPLWMGSTRRDPFQLTARASGTNQPARELLALQATWRQTDRSLAVVNGRIVAEGDTILGFRIESIDGDFIWVQGPAGREQVEFVPVMIPANTHPNGTVSNDTKGTGGAAGP